MNPNISFSKKLIAFIAAVITLLSSTAISSLFPYNTVFAQNWEKHGRLIVSKKNPHYLSYKDGTPFFWLGDTGWALFERLNREEVKYYFEKRKEQGFNVIQAALLFDINGLNAPNAYGDTPLKNLDSVIPNFTPGNSFKDSTEYDYWDHADYIIQQAAKTGLFIAVLPCWGEYVLPREHTKALFQTTIQAYNYGNFVGKRYHAYKNILWVLGGDRLPDEKPDGVEMWRAMAKGIADGVNGISDQNGNTDYSTTLMTYHCFDSSSKWFQNDSWLDMNMWGSYHIDYNNPRNYKLAEADYKLKPIKPTINGEASYEFHPVNYQKNNGHFTPYDVRQSAYWSVFAGTCGHTYGCNPVWQFYDKGRQPLIMAKRYWKDALNAEGANQMKFLKNLIESRPMLDLKPMQSLLIKTQNSYFEHCQAIAGKDYAFIYISEGYSQKIQMGKISGKKVVAWWFNPRNGEAVKIGEYKNSGEVEFTPPGISKELTWLRTGRGCDWVLVLDDASKYYSAPGKNSLLSN